MRLHLTSRLEKNLEKIKKREPSLYRGIQKQLVLFSSDPKHPSLRIHKLTGKYRTAWSLSVGSNIRMLYYLLPDGGVLFFDVGTHDEVYREN